MRGESLFLCHLFVPFSYYQSHSHVAGSPAVLPLSDTVGSLCSYLCMGGWDSDRERNSMTVIVPLLPPFSPTSPWGRGERLGMHVYLCVSATCLLCTSACHCCLHLPHPFLPVCHCICLWEEYVAYETTCYLHSAVI